MDRVELRDALRDAGIADELNELAGMHLAGRQGDEFNFLEERDGEWIVGAQERGRRDVIAKFSSEDEACRFFYKKLVSIWGAHQSYLPSPEEEQRGQRMTEELIQRFQEMENKRWGARGGEGDGAS